MNRAQVFLRSYRLTGSISKAAKAAKIDRQMHYRRLKVDEAYAAAFAEAHEEALRKLLEDAGNRAAKIRALEISSRDARAQAIQDRWNMLRRGVLLIVEERGADMMDVPGGSSGLLARDYKGKSAEQVVYKVDPGLVALLGELRAHEKQGAEELGQWLDRKQVTGPNGGPVQTSLTVEFVDPPKL